MQEIIMTHGVPASGKSTWAKEYIAKHLDYVRINRDDLRSMFADKKVHHVEQFENFVSDMQRRILSGALVRGNNVVIDDTNLNKKSVDSVLTVIQQYCNDYDKSVSVKHIVMEADVYDCIARDSKRESPLGSDIINKFQGDLSKAKQQGWLKNLVTQMYPSKGSVFTDKKLAVICDLDGTLAIINDRNVYDTAKCEQDLINDPIKIILESVQSMGYEIIFVSGRSDAYRTQTQNWLDATGITYRWLFMRKQGDSRKDAIVKREIYDTLIEPAFSVEFALDDRNQVVDMWRNLGITCLQVAPGDF